MRPYLANSGDYGLWDMLFSRLRWIDHWIEFELVPTLTKRLCDRAKPRKAKYEIPCATLRGFFLRVLPTGSKVYYVRHVLDGRDKRTRIGLVGEVTFTDARRRALEILSKTEKVERLPAPPRLHSVAAVPSSATPRVRDFRKRYVRDHGRTLKPKTRSIYRASLDKIVAEFGDLRLDEITRAGVEAWHASMSATPYAANAAVRVLSSMFSKAEDWEVLPSSFVPPTRRLKHYRERGRERFLSPEERIRIEEALQRGTELPQGAKGNLSWKTAAILRLLSLTGMRRDEVLDLTWNMVDVRHRVFRLPESKTGQKVVPFGAPVLRVLELAQEHRRAGCDYIFPTCTGRRMDSSSITRSWRKLRGAIGLDDVRLHDLRHSAASDALMSGVPLAVVGKILGHRNPSTTARYAHISDSVLRDAVETMSSTIERNARAGRGE